MRFRELMALEKVGGATFESDHYDAFPAKNLFGGHLVAQALWASGQTVRPEWTPHSLHAYFVRPGLGKLPVTYDVVSVKDGRSFLSRSVTASQGGRTIFTMSASFERVPLGRLRQPHGDSAAVLPGPSECVPDEQMAGAPLPTFPATDDFEVRFPPASLRVPRPFQPCWVRSRESYADALTRACALSFISDMGVLSSMLLPNEAEYAYAGASLDHAVWFGRLGDTAGWCSFDMSPSMRNGSRALAHGSVRDIDGFVMASIAQEGYFPQFASAHQESTT